MELTYPSRFRVEGSAVRCYQLGCILAHKCLVDRLGGFNTDYRHGEDVDWFFRLQEHGARFELLDDVVVHYRRHSSNMTVTEANGILDIVAVLQSSLARRRQIAAELGKNPNEIYYVQPDVLKIGRTPET